MITKLQPFHLQPITLIYLWWNRKIRIREIIVIGSWFVIIARMSFYQITITRWKMPWGRIYVGIWSHVNVRLLTSLHYVDSIPTSPDFLLCSRHYYCSCFVTRPLIIYKRGRETYLLEHVPRIKAWSVPHRLGSNPAQASLSSPASCLSLTITIK